jgi:signal transduction histidine kinase
VVTVSAVVSWRRARLRAEAVAVERRRLARELHDSVGHHLSLIALAGSVASTRELAVQGLAELRATVRGLRGPPPDLSALVARARRAWR